jgi:hypothetical protein
LDFGLGKTEENNFGFSILDASISLSTGFGLGEEARDMRRF